MGTTATVQRFCDENSPDVAVIAGSYSDINVAKKTTNILDKMGITYDSQCNISYQTS